MKLDKILGEYHLYSGKASELVRQLALVGIAVIWIFKVDKAGSSFPTVPRILVWPTIALLFSLLLDFLQYCYGGVMYDVKYRIYERQKKRDHLAADHEFKISPKLLWPMDVAFYLKIVCVTSAYVLLGIHLAKQLFS